MKIILLQTIEKAEVSEEACIDVGAGWGSGGICPQDFAINKEMPLIILENAPSLLRNKCPRSILPPKFEMILTSLDARATCVPSS